MKKKFLLYSTLLIGAAGLLTTCAPFIGSLSPNETHIDRLPSVDVSSMEVGQTIEYKGHYLYIYIRREASPGIYSLIALPYRNNNFYLPEFDWSRPALPCETFGLSKRSTYKCLDGPDRWWDYMEWDINGNYVGIEKWEFEVVDLIRPKYKYKNGNIYLFES